MKPILLRSIGLFALIAMFAFAAGPPTALAAELDGLFSISSDADPGISLATDSPDGAIVVLVAGTAALHERMPSVDTLMKIYLDSPTASHGLDVGSEGGGLFGASFIPIVA